LKNLLISGAFSCYVWVLFFNICNMAKNTFELNCRSLRHSDASRLPRVTVDDRGATEVDCDCKGEENRCLAVSSISEEFKQCCFEVGEMRAEGSVLTKPLNCRSLNRKSDLENDRPFQAIFQFVKDGSTRVLCTKRGTEKWDFNVCAAVSGVAMESEKSCIFSQGKLSDHVNTSVESCNILSKGGQNYDAVIQEPMGDLGKEDRLLCQKYNDLDDSCKVKSSILFEGQQPCDK